MKLLKIKTLFSLFLALSTLTTHSWTFSGITAWATQALQAAKDSIVQTVQERPALAAGIGIVAITAVGIYALAKRKWSGNTMPNDNVAAQEPKTSPVSQQPVASAPAVSIEIITHTVPQQTEGNTCGYHSLHNGARMLTMLNEHGIIEEQALIKPFSRLSDWQKKVGVTQDLTQDNIQRAAEMVTPLKKNQYCIIPNITEFIQDPAHMENEPFYTITANIERLQQCADSRPFCFILGDMKHIEKEVGQVGPSIKEGYGHWVTVVAQPDCHNKTITLHYANSMPSHAMDETLMTLRKCLKTNTKLLEAKKQASNIMERIVQRVKQIHINQDAQEKAELYQQCLDAILYDIVDKHNNYLSSEDLTELLNPLGKSLKLINDWNSQQRDTSITTLWEQLKERVPTITKEYVNVL